MNTGAEGISSSMLLIIEPMNIGSLGIKAVDDHTFEVQLELPCEFLLGLMAFPSTFPLNQAFYEEHADTYAQSPEDMLYCGPYTMTDWQQGNEYTFTKRDDYFNQDEEAADSVTFKFIQDTQSAMLAYQQGDIDVVKLQSEQVDQYKDSEGFTNRLTGYMWYLSVNFTRETLQNDNLRAAIAYGIDRETIVDSVLKDGSVAAEGIIPFEFATSPAGTDYRDDAGAIVEYDPDKAAEYYAAAVEELGGDVTFDLLFEDSEASKAVAENIQSQLQTACPGLTVNLDSKPKKTRLDLMDTQEYDVCLTRWGPDYADPQTYMDLFVTWNASSNDGKYDNAEYDELIKKLKREGVETLEKFKEVTKEDLAKRKEQQAENDFTSALIAKVTEDAEVDIPMVMVENEVNRLYRNFENQMMQSGYTAKQYFEASGQNEADLKEMMKPEAENNVKTSLVLEEIVKAENIEIDEDAIEAEYKNMSETYGMDVDRIKQLVSPDSIQYDLAQKKAIELLKESVK